MTRTIIRKARKRHLCDDSYSGVRGHHIEPGDIYAYHVCSPHDPEVGNDRWWHVRECARCHERRTGVVLTKPLWQALRDARRVGVDA